MMALHQFQAPTTSMRGPCSSIWSRENGVTFRRTLGDIAIHGIESLARLSVLGMTLEDGTVIRTRKCSFHVCHAWPMLDSACVDRVQTRTLKVMAPYGGWICGEFVCRWSLRFKPKGCCDAIMRVGSSTLRKGDASEVSMLLKGSSSG